MGGLHDQIHVEASGAEGLEQLGCHPGPVGHVGEGQHRLVCFEFGAIHGLTQLQPLMANRPGGATGEQGAGLLAPAGAHH